MVREKNMAGLKMSAIRALEKAQGCSFEELLERNPKAEKACKKVLAIHLCYVLSKWTWYRWVRESVHPNVEHVLRTLITKDECANYGIDPMDL